MIKNILSTGAWSYCQGSPQGKGKESRKTRAVSHKNLTALVSTFFNPLGMDSEAGSVRMRRQPVGLPNTQADGRFKGIHQSRTRNRYKITHKKIVKYCPELKT